MRLSSATTGTSKPCLGFSANVDESPFSCSSALTRIVSALDSDLPPPEPQTMNQFLAQFRAQPRFRAILLTVFAGLALLLAMVGIYGVVSYSVSQQTHEIGIRMALGAQHTEILRLVLRKGMVLALMGVCIGVAGASGLARFISSLLYGVSLSDPFTFAVVSLILMSVALLASYIPARRATKVDPMVALRCE
jgi:putative ABC transport system permease protein